MEAFPLTGASGTGGDVVLVCGGGGEDAAPGAAAIEKGGSEKLLEGTGGGWLKKPDGFEASLALKGCACGFRDVIPAEEPFVVAVGNEKPELDEDGNAFVEGPDAKILLEKDGVACVCGADGANEGAGLSVKMELS